VLINCGGIIGTAPVIEAGGGRNNLWGGGFGKALVDTETKTKLTITPPPIPAVTSPVSSVNER
jgi:hypothetical protein